MSQEQRQKISNAKCGKKRAPFSDEWKTKMAIAHRGKPHPHTGYKKTAETKQKLSKALSGVKNPMYGKRHSEEEKRKISEAGKGRIGWNRGVPCPEETRSLISRSLKGRIQTERARKLNSDAHLLEKNPAWKGGISFEPYCFKFDDKFREHVREKFGRKCYLCPTSETDNGKKLNVHHIDYNKNSICNGQEWAFLPLCQTHHSKTNYNRWYWFNRLIYYWIEKYIDFNSF